MQLGQDDCEGEATMDAESDRKLEGDEDINLDAPLPMQDSIEQLAALQTSARSHSTQEKTSVQPDWGW